MEKGFTSKHIAHVDPGDFPGLDSVLHQESGQCRLNEPVLIPIGMPLNELHHGLLQSQGKFRLKTHHIVSTFDDLLQTRLH
jgi:hypothetical protein